MIASRNHPVNCGRATSTFTWAFPKQSVADRAIRNNASLLNRITAPGTVSEFEVDDRLFMRQTGASSVTDYVVDASVLVPFYSQLVSFSSSNTAVLSNPEKDGLGRLVATYQSSGPCSLLATARDGESSAIGVTASATVAGSVDTPVGYVQGSLARHCSEQIAQRVAAGGAKEMFLTQDGTTFIRNQNSWLADVDLTCASPWNSTGGLQRAGTLVSPRHVIWCNHFGFFPAVGATIKFVSMTNEVVTRTVVAHAAWNGSPPLDLAPDVRVGLLDSDVPEIITFAEVLPSNWRTYLPSVGSSPSVLNRSRTIPMFFLNRVERANAQELLEVGRGRAFFQGYAPAPAYIEAVVSGDSGNPHFMLINNRPVLIGPTSTPSTCTHLSSDGNLDAVNSVMSSLGGGYQLTTVDLSEFASY